MQFTDDMFSFPLDSVPAAAATVRPPSSSVSPKEPADAAAPSSRSSSPSSSRSRPCSSTRACKIRFDCRRAAKTWEARPRVYLYGTLVGTNPREFGSSSRHESRSTSARTVALTAPPTLLVQGPLPAIRRREVHKSMKHPEDGGHRRFKLGLHSTPFRHAPRLVKLINPARGQASSTRSCPVQAQTGGSSSIAGAPPLMSAGPVGIPSIACAKTYGRWL